MLDSAYSYEEIKPIYQNTKLAYEYTIKAKERLQVRFDLRGEKMSTLEEINFQLTRDNTKAVRKGKNKGRLEGFAAGTIITLIAMALTL